MLKHRKFIPILLVFFIVYFATTTSWAAPEIGQKNTISTESPHESADNNLCYMIGYEEQRSNNITTHDTYSKTINNIYSTNYIFAGITVVNNIYNRLTNLNNDLTQNTMLIKSLFTNNLNKTESKDHNTSTNGPDKQQVEIEFKKIQSIPYNVKTMNCADKSNLFAHYLYENGARQIDMVVIEHSSGKYSHEFVEWDGHYYDACNTGASHTEPESLYLTQLENIGFSGLTITSPYNP